MTHISRYLKVTEYNLLKILAIFIFNIGLLDIRSEAYTWYKIRINVHFPNESDFMICIHINSQQACLKLFWIRVS